MCICWVLCYFKDFAYNCNTDYIYIIPTSRGAKRNRNPFVLAKVMIYIKKQSPMAPVIKMNSNWKLIGERKYY